MRLGQVVSLVSGPYKGPRVRLDRRSDWDARPFSSPRCLSARRWAGWRGLVGLRCRLWDNDLRSVVSRAVGNSARPRYGQGAAR